MYKYTCYYVVVARAFTSPENYDDKMFVCLSVRLYDESIQGVSFRGQRNEYQQ